MITWKSSIHIPAITTIISKVTIALRMRMRMQALTMLIRVNMFCIALSIHDTIMRVFFSRMWIFLRIFSAFIKAIIVTWYRHRKWAWILIDHEMWMHRGEYVVTGIRKWNCFVIAAVDRFSVYISHPTTRIILAVTKQKLLSKMVNILIVWIRCACEFDLNRVSFFVLSFSCVGMFGRQIEAIQWDLLFICFVSRSRLDNCTTGMCRNSWWTGLGDHRRRTKVCDNCWLTFVRTLFNWKCNAFLHHNDLDSLPQIFAMSWTIHRRQFIGWVENSKRING